MFYKYRGTFKSKNSDISQGFSDKIYLNCFNTFITSDNITKHFTENYPGIPFILKGLKLTFLHKSITFSHYPNFIFITDKLIFVGIGDQFISKLEIRNHDGNILKTFKSSKIIHKDGRFISFDEPPYIINSFANTAFCKFHNSSISHCNILDFSDDGRILYLNNNGVLVISSMTGCINYDQNLECIDIIGSNYIYSNTIIDNVICACNFQINLNIESTDTTCFVLLNENCIFLIYKDIVIKKNISKSYYKIDIAEFNVHNYVESESFYDMILCLSIFVPDIKISNAIKIEDMLSKLFIINKHVEKFLINIYDSYLDNSDLRDNILCRVYRRIDDYGKCFLDKYLDFKVLTSDNLCLVIIYKLDLIDHFIKLCIEEKRLFYLADLVSFYEKIERSEEFKLALLKNGLFIYNYDGLEDIIGLEKIEIESQRNAFNYEKQRYNFFK